MCRRLLIKNGGIKHDKNMGSDGGADSHARDWIMRRVCDRASAGVGQCVVSARLRCLHGAILMIIMGRSQYGVEEIDEAETHEEAEKLLAEYRMAFGDGWALWIKGGK